MFRLILGLILIVLGISALTGGFVLKFLFAMILIILGIRLLYGKRGGYSWGDKNSVSEDFINEMAIFSPINKKVVSQNFKGGKIIAIFGGGEIDISEVKTDQKNIDMEFTAIFGGGKLIVPKGWKINSRGTAIFGGYDNKTALEGSEQVILNLRGTAIFGGIEIIN
jgi:hypothetical protein